jgi:hypothetical protein
MTCDSASPGPRRLSPTGSHLAVKPLLQQHIAAAGESMRPVCEAAGRVVRSDEHPGTNVCVAVGEDVGDRALA